MKLRGRYDVAQRICDDAGLKVDNPLVRVVSEDRLYCKYKLCIYYMELECLIEDYSSTFSPTLKEKIDRCISRTMTLCDFSIERGADVQPLYNLIEEYYCLSPK